MFLAAFLGVLTGIFLDWRKNVRESNKRDRERRIKELTTLNVINTAVVFNIREVRG